MLPTVVTAAAPARPLGFTLATALAGAAGVALAAQIAIPLPGTPVPMTLQPLAVLIAGGLLGPRIGALSMALYLALGALGLPVFTPLGVPGLGRLIGPTGGYLLAYPFAAAAVGAIAASRTWTAVSLGALAGMVVIHIGGWAQLAILTGSAPNALVLGNLPFLFGDALKVAIAALAIRAFAGRSRPAA